MRRVRERVVIRGDGLREVTLGCACATVGRLLTVWEPVEGTLEELREQHRREAPGCPHRAWVQS